MDEPDLVSKAESPPQGATRPREERRREARAQAEAALRQAEGRLAARERLLAGIGAAQARFIASASPAQVFGGLLETLLALTDSRFGFIGEVLRGADGQPYLKTHAVTNIAWNEATRDFYARHASTGMEFRNLATLFGAVLAAGQPVIANDPGSDPRRGGLPPGHPPLTAFLGLPIRQAGELVGMAGVASRPGGYDEELGSFLEPFLETCGSLVRAYHLDAQRRAMADLLAQSEEEHHRLAQQFAALLDAIPDRLTMQSADLRIQWANRGAGRALGQDPAALEGQRCYSLWHRRATPCDPCPVGRAFRSGAPEADVVTALDGGVWELRAVPLREANGRVTRVIEVGREVTEQRRLEESLREAQKLEAVGRLAGGMAHEFNNLMQAILGQVELAGRELGPGNPLRPRLAAVERSAARAADLTAQLLAFARRGLARPRVFGLNPLVAAVADRLRGLAGEGVTFAWSPAPDLWPVCADPGQIEQVLVNLVANARDAVAGAGTIAIATENAVVTEADCPGEPGAAPGEYAVLSVGDTGCGMTPETLSQVFEPFFTTKGVGRGTGLGLPAVLGIVRQAGGFVRIRSALGAGTEVRLHLPRAGATG